MGPIRCAETSVKDCHSTLCKDPEGRRSHQHRGGSLKSQLFSMCEISLYSIINRITFETVKRFFLKAERIHSIKVLRDDTMSYGTTNRYRTCCFHFQSRQTSGVRKQVAPKRCYHPLHYAASDREQRGARMFRNIGI